MTLSHVFGYRIGAGGPSQNTCVCGLVLGAPAKTRASVVWCWGPQPKHVRLWFGGGGPSQNTCVCGLVLGAPAKHVRQWFGAGVPAKTRAPVVWCWGSQPNTCACGLVRGSQPKHVRLWFGAGGPSQNTCACGLVLGAKAKTRAPVVWCWGPQPKHVSNTV